MNHVLLQSVPEFPKGDLAFIDLLKQHVPFVPRWNGEEAGPTDALDARAGMHLQFDFPDPEGLLETACFDFERFLKEAGLAGNGIEVQVSGSSGEFAWEEYRLTVGEDAVMLEASDTEGIRRGMYYLMDLLAGSPLLKKGQSRRKPWLKNRISRCFFGPIKRPPFNVDELMNDIDYYPPEYLSRLAREGVNGLWLTVTFREICDTSIRPACPDAPRRLAKLRDTVNRCRRYGIKIWVFCIEPINWCRAAGNPVPEGFEELLGPGYSAAEAGAELASFCVNSETARKYLYECTYSLFHAVPNLGGMLTISHGERTTSCLSTIGAFSDGEIPCPKRCGKSIGEILADVLGSMKKGMADANPRAELISWLYMPYVPQVSSWITQFPSRLNNDVALAFNFESGVTKTQLNTVRAGGDYWLSQVGPSDRFTMMAQAAKGHCEFAAKLQVACSHECATVPYIPAPGLVYRKYRKMKELDVKHVIQCWYFGNYPGTMNEAAGKLAYEDFTRSEDDFLLDLAKPHWGKDAPAVVEAWKHFADGYGHYPLDFQFQYYGPMHDGTVWPLHLKQVMTSLPRTWKPEMFPAGDAMGECMLQFQLYETAQLAGMMSEEWHKGMEVLKNLSRENHELEFTLAEALDIQFRSGRNILNFYAMRNALLDGAGDAAGKLAAMAEIVREEIRNSRRLAELCRQDPRLGYHSEAEVYKYFPAKLQWRVKCLESLLEEDFSAAEKVLASGGSLQKFLEKDEPPAVPGRWYGNGCLRWLLETDARAVTFHVEVLKKFRDPENLSIFAMDRKGESSLLFYQVIEKKDEYLTENGWKVDVTIPRLKLRLQDVFFFGTELAVLNQDGEKLFYNDKEGDFRHDPRLNLGYFEADKLRKVSVNGEQSPGQKSGRL